MLKCWEEEPNDRPTFQNLRKTMKEMERKHKVRWLGNMINVVLHLQEKIDCFATYQSQDSYITNITSLFVKMETRKGINWVEGVTV